MQYLISKSADSKKEAKALVLKLGHSILKKDIKIECTDSGKPYIKDSSYGISISHSKDMALVAINENAVGADIEVVRPFNEKLIKRYFSKEEIAFIDSPEKFFTIWTVKEAYLKLTGDGLKGIKKLNTVINGEIKIEGYNVLTKNENGYVFSIVYK